MKMAKSRTTAANKTGSAANLLGKIGKKSKATSTSKTPVVNITDQAHLSALKAIYDAKIKQKEAESARTVAEGGFRDKARELYEARCREDGTLHTSVKFVGTLDDQAGGEPVSVSFTQARKCGKMVEDEASDPLHSVFGNEFDNLFAPERTIAIDTGVLSDDQIVAAVEALQEAIGDSFDSAVTVESLIVPKEAFYGRRILDDKIRKLAARAASDGYAKVNTPFFKI
jgi:hypothetical protein